MRNRNSTGLPDRHNGFNLMELLVAMALGAVLLTGLVQIVAGARNSFRLQESLGEVQESGRFVIDSLGNILRQSAYTPQPWLETDEPVGLTPDTADATSRHGDRLAVRTWSDRNCFGNLNPEVDAAGLARFFLRENVLELSASKSLLVTCRYGPEEARFVTQILRQGLVQNIDAFQVQYAEDIDADGLADRWVDGGAWNEEGTVLGLRIAVLIRSTESVVEPAPRVFSVLGDEFTAPADGRLRRVFNYAQAFSSAGR